MRTRARAMLMLCLISGAALAACNGDEDAVALERGERAPLAQAEYTYHHSEEYEGRVLWETHAVADIGDRLLMAVLYPGDRSGIAGGFTAHLVDRSTGELVGEITTVRSHAFGAYHAASGRLVVAYMRLAPPPDHEPDAPGGFAPWYWLMSFDVAAGLAPEIAVPLGPDVAEFSTGPGRVVERGTLTLSRDGRYAYVALSGQSDDARPGVAVIDLEGDAEIIGPVPYPSQDERMCGRVEPAIYPYEQSSVIVTCTAGGLARVIEPDGRVREDFDINGMGYVFGYPEWGDRVVEVATAVEAPGGLGLVQRDGTYAVLQGGSITEVGRALPDRTTLLPNWGSDVFMLDDTRLVLPYRTREDAAGAYVPFGTPSASGLVVFDLQSESITHNFVIGHRGSYPLADGSIAIVEEGRVDIIDLEEERIVQSFEAVTLEDQVGAEAAAEMPPGRMVLPRVR